MTVKEAYDKMDGDYTDIFSRLPSDEKIVKFLSMFNRDTTFSDLCEQFENKNYPEAFRSAHTLKGLCQNMSLSGLLEPTAALTECLRGGGCPDGTQEHYEELKIRYQTVKDVIGELIQGDA